MRAGQDNHPGGHIVADGDGSANWRGSPPFGRTGRSSARRIREEATGGWDDTVGVERFTGKGGRFVRGRATVTGNRTIVVDGQEFRASRGLVLATGT